MRYRKKWIVITALLCLLVKPAGVYAAAPESAQEALPETSQDTVQDATQPTGETVQPAPVRLMLDSENLYGGMDRAYAQGYLPKVENQNAYLVAPIISSGSLKEQCIRVSLDLGDAANAPFVMKNYEKKINLGLNSVNNGSKTVESYVADFSLELKEDRCNGSYPVTLNIGAQDEQGNAVELVFTVYVTVTDGRDPKQDSDSQTALEPPVFAPKVLVQTCRFSESEILAGDDVTVDITLVNTSRTEAVKNMSVAIDAPVEKFTLLSESDTVYVGNLPAGKTCVVSYRYHVNAETGGGQYNLALTMDYADSKGNTYTGNGRARMDVRQPPCMQFDPLVIAPQVAVADVVEARIQAMNLGRGRVYNVRAVIEADGLLAQGTIFIGDMEPGTQASGSTQVTVGSMSGSSLYGVTEGVVTFYFEDALGQEQTETGTFCTTILSPFSEGPQEPEDDQEQWWVIMAVIGAILCIFAVIIVVRAVKSRKEYEAVE